MVMMMRNVFIDIEKMVNSEHPDWTASSGSALFAQTYLSETWDHYICDTVTANNVYKDETVRSRSE